MARVYEPIRNDAADPATLSVQFCFLLFGLQLADQLVMEFRYLFLWFPVPGLAKTDVDAKSLLFA